MRSLQLPDNLISAYTISNTSSSVLIDRKKRTRHGHWLMLRVMWIEFDSRRKTSPSWVLDIFGWASFWLLPIGLRNAISCKAVARIVRKCGQNPNDPWRNRNLCAQIQTDFMRIPRGPTNGRRHFDNMLNRMRKNFCNPMAKNELAVNSISVWNRLGHLNKFIIEISIRRFAYALGKSAHRQ